MDMYKWLQDCYKEGSLTLKELEDAMKYDGVACKLWEDWSHYSRDFVDHVRNEVAPFLDELKKNSKDSRKNEVQAL